MTSMPMRAIPYRIVVAVTPSDATQFTPTDALHIGGAGTLVVDSNGVQTTIAGIIAGTILPIRTTRVYATGTTATNIVRMHYKA